MAASQKKCQEEERTLIFVDESAFYLLPGVVRTYAPKAETPVLRSPLSRDHLSVISGITPEGKLHVQVLDHAFKGKDCARFLKHLSRHIGGNLLVVWDGAPIHNSQPIKDFLATKDGHRVRLERLPGYAPDLNPDEGVWSHAKFVEMKNLCCENIERLKVEIRKALDRLRHKSDIIKACFQCLPDLEINA